MCAQTRLVLVDRAVREAFALEGPTCHDHLGCGGHIILLDQGPLVLYPVVSVYLDHSLDKVYVIVRIHYLFVRGYFVCRNADRIAEEKQLMVLLYKEFAL